MKQTKILFCFAITLFSVQIGICQTKKTAISKQSLDGFIKQNFKKSIRFEKVLVGNFYGSDVYFVQGFNAKNDLNERQMIFQKKGVFRKSNRFFYHCENFGVISHKHKNTDVETPNDLKNLRVWYDSDGQFRVKDAAIMKTESQAIKDEEHIGSAFEIVSFQEYVSEKHCKNL